MYDQGTEVGAADHREDRQLLSGGRVPKALCVEGPSFSEVLENAHPIALSATQYFLKKLERHDQERSL